MFAQEPDLSPCGSLYAGTSLLRFPSAGLVASGTTPTRFIRCAPVIPLTPASTSPVGLSIS